MLTRTVGFLLKLIGALNGQSEIDTIFRIGCSRMTVAHLLAAEILIRGVERWTLRRLVVAGASQQ